MLDRGQNAEESLAGTHWAGTLDLGKSKSNTVNFHCFVWFLLLKKLESTKGWNTPHNFLNRFENIRHDDTLDDSVSGLHSLNG